MADMKLLEKLPEICDVDELHTLLCENEALIVAFTGKEDIGIMLKKFYEEQVAGARTSDRGIQFSKEGARVWNDDTVKSKKAVNPRDVVLGLYLAIEALELGHGRDKPGVIGHGRLPEICSFKYMTFTVESYAIYPMFDWKDAHFTANEQNEVVGWIRAGRDKISDRDKFVA